ncbi:hypothetical protein FRACYDRAFT_257642 [Fragilariopsis cylindrus CCMP1102]|uniref:Uncharacterized protein n=1 Tax=Fragilariopsis cylindrus CCMP1102 TaxID=635003 RepID=A0A1E7EJ04_9STRA|nr:hypothetical protein FRACYDRAFT_257642 [Fragilariopsis cylindrus CCMP1102]|eukprot:OEU05874.1 hypothetical protein FRACYDRAFT_257642 [Fragilariopsis cylindrus CCMP1102]
MMSGYITKPPGKINSSLVEFLPELESEYSKYPMKHKRWLQPNEKGPKGEPCFVAATEANEETKVKKDYTFCKKGPNGKGYYSLMCRVSYINLHNRIGSVAPAGCGGGLSNREEFDRYDDCKRVIFMRQFCSVPNDDTASNQVMNNAVATAQMVYNGTQNEQLVLNAVF